MSVSKVANLLERNKQVSQKPNKLSVSDLCNSENSKTWKAPPTLSDMRDRAVKAGGKATIISEQHMH
jgi:hypothetical protein